MRWLLLLLLAPVLALAQGPSVTRDLGSIQTGPRILGEPEFAFEMDALSQAETSLPGWPVTTVRAGTANCIGGGVAAANQACIGIFGLESFPSGVGGRTAADVHTVSTTGWPTTTGEVRLQYTPSAAPAVNTYILDSRPPGQSSGPGYGVYFNGTANLVGFVGNGTTRFDTATSGLTWTPSVTYVIRLVWGGTTVTLYRAVCGAGGCGQFSQVAQRTDASMPASLHTTAGLGSNSSGVGQPSGSIRFMRISP